MKTQTTIKYQHRLTRKHVFKTPYNTEEVYLSGLSLAETDTPTMLSSYTRHLCYGHGSHDTVDIPHHKVSLFEVKTIITVTKL
jgi:hypothetical protein